MKVAKENLVPFRFRLFVFKGCSCKWEMKTNKQTKKKKANNENNNTFLCKKRNHISRALLGTKFNCTETENTIVLPKVYPC